MRVPLSLADDRRDFLPRSLAAFSPSIAGTLWMSLWSVLLSSWHGKFCALRSGSRTVVRTIYHKTPRTWVFSVFSDVRESVVRFRSRVALRTFVATMTRPSTNSAFTVERKTIPVSVPLASDELFYSVHH